MLKDHLGPKKDWKKEDWLKHAWVQRHNPWIDEEEREKFRLNSPFLNNNEEVDD